jgi:hypothetical protein
MDEELTRLLWNLQNVLTELLWSLELYLRDRRGGASSV